MERLNKSAIMTEINGRIDDGGALCAISGLPIPEERIEALKMLGVPRDQWTRVEHSQTTKKRGLFLGKPGVSELLIASNLGEAGIEKEPTD